MNFSRTHPRTKRMSTARHAPPRGLQGLGFFGEEALDAAVNQARAMYASGQQAAESALEYFRSKASEFEQAYVEFKNTKSDAYAAGMGQRYDDTEATMDRVKSMIEGAVAAWELPYNLATQATRAVSSDQYATFGTWLYNITHPGNPKVDAPTPLGPVVATTPAPVEGFMFGLRGLRGLGITVAIQAAAVAGITAAIIYALHLYRDYRTELMAAQTQLIREGKLDPSALNAPSIIGETGTLLKWAALIGIGYFIALPLLKKRGML